MTEKDKKRKDAKHPQTEPAAAPAGGSNPTPADAGGSTQPATGAEAAPPATMVALSMEEYDALQKSQEQALAQAAEYFDGWQRERADFANYKRRIERDSAQTYQNALGNVVKKYLVILDDLERALKARPASPDGAAWFEGVELIYRKLLNLLEMEGGRQMDAANELFDPTRHEAIMQQDSPDHQSGQIIEVIQPGYLLGDRVIRPALVRVAR